jgi:hypothetical protein
MAVDYLKSCWPGMPQDSWEAAVRVWTEEAVDQIAMEAVAENPIPILFQPDMPFPVEWLSQATEKVYPTYQRPASTLLTPPSRVTNLLPPEGYSQANMIYDKTAKKWVPRTPETEATNDGGNQTGTNDERYGGYYD